MSTSATSRLSNRPPHKGFLFFFFPSTTINQLIKTTHTTNTTMKFIFGTTLLLSIALSLPAPEVPKEPTVSISEESTVIPPCQQICPPEWAPVCAKDEYDNIVIFSSFCLFYNANCGRQRYILGRIEECIGPGENTPIPPIISLPFAR